MASCFAFGTLTSTLLYTYIYFLFMDINKKGLERDRDSGIREQFDWFPLTDEELLPPTGCATVQSGERQQIGPEMSSS